MGSLNDVIVRPAVPADVPEIVDAHLESFPGFFLTFLGRDFLTVLYGCLRADPDGVLLVACREGRVAGFVGGVLHQRGFYGRAVRRRLWAFAHAALWATMKRPTIVPRLFRALRRPSESQQSPAEACLMSIAVRPGVAGRGLGQRLVRDFCDALAQRGAPAVCLTTDRDDNERTNRFYLRFGFRVSSCVVTPEGRAMNQYIMTLPLKD